MFKTKIKTITATLTDDRIVFSGPFIPKNTPGYLDLAKEITKKGINPLKKKWIFTDRAFEDLMELAAAGLGQHIAEARKLEKDIECLEILEDLNFEKGYVKFHKDVPSEIMINTFRALPTMWHLGIIKGNKEWRNISAFAEEYFSSQSPENLRSITQDYLEEGDN